MNKKQKIFVTNNSVCVRRVLDAIKLIKYFKLNNCPVIKNPQEADIIIFVSCAFKKNKEQECFRIIKKYRHYRGELIILGCLPEIAQSKFKKAFKGKYLITKDLHTIDQFFANFKIKFSDVPDANSCTEDFIPPAFPRSRFSFIISFIKQFEFSKDFYKKCIDYIKRKNNTGIAADKEKEEDEIGVVRVGCGCAGNCAYCSFRKAIGKLKSKPLDVCLSEYKKVLDRGYKTIQLVGSDVGAYGLDIGSSFSKLLKELASVDNGSKARWEIWDFNPRWAVEYSDTLLEVIKKGKINRLSCPIQSGSERILRSMHRYNNIDNLTRILSEFKRVDPDLRLSTDIMVGFPSETDNEFLSTLDLVKKIGFYSVSIFPYYDAESAYSYGLSNKVGGGKIRKRLRIAKEFCDRERIKYFCTEIGK